MKYFSSCRDSRPVERNSANKPFQLIVRDKVETKCKQKLYIYFTFSWETWLVSSYMKKIFCIIFF